MHKTTKLAIALPVVTGASYITQSVILWIVAFFIAWEGLATAVLLKLEARSDKANHS